MKRQMAITLIFISDVFYMDLTQLSKVICELLHLLTYNTYSDVLPYTSS